MKKKELQAISLFSGAGGMDIGVRDAGFNILAEIEFDQHCCATLEANAEAQGYGTRVIHADIRNINPKQLMTELSIKKVGQKVLEVLKNEIIAEFPSSETAEIANILADRHYIDLPKDEMWC